MNPVNRVLMLLAGVSGASGVALAAVASHGSLTNAGPASQMLLAHAPALLALALWPASASFRPRPLLFGAGLIGLGIFLFAGSLVLHAMTGLASLGMAAPTGGMLTILGWLAIALAAFLPRP